MDEPKPCPICGHKASEPEKVNRPISKGRPVWEIGCGVYCIFMRRGSKKELIAGWNTRAECNNCNEKNKLDTGGGCSICGTIPAVNIEGTYWLCGSCVAEKLNGSATHFKERST